MPNGNDDEFAQYKVKPSAEDEWAQYKAKPAPKPSAYERLTSPYDPSAAAFGEKHPIVGQAVRGLSAIGGAIMGLPGGLYHTFADEPTPEEEKLFEGHTRIPGELGIERMTSLPLVQGAQEWANPETRPSIGGAMSVLPEALGGGIGTVIGAELGGEALGRVRRYDIPGRIGEALRTPRGALKPGVQTTARLAGAAAGHAVAPGFGGEIGGAIVGPGIADLIIPEHPNPTGWVVKLPGRMPRLAAEALPEPEIFPAATSSAKPIGTAILPAEPLQGEPTLFPRVMSREEVAPPVRTGATPNEGVSILPEPREAMPGDRPEAMWSVGREDVLPEAAQRGTPGAGDVLRSIGKPIIYVPREGVGFPGRRPRIAVPKERP